MQFTDTKIDILFMNLIRNNPREGWAADSARVAEMGDDELTWPEFANDEDTSM